MFFLKCVKRIFSKSDVKGVFSHGQTNSLAKDFNFCS